MEWQVVGVLIALLGLLTAVVTPVVRLNSSITKLNTTMEHITKEVDGLKTDNHGSHKRLWDKNEEQDKVLNDHETRITTLERK